MGYMLLIIFSSKLFFFSIIIIAAIITPPKDQDILEVLCSSIFSLTGILNVLLWKYVLLIWFRNSFTFKTLKKFKAGYT